MLGYINNCFFSFHLDFFRQLIIGTFRSDFDFRHLKFARQGFVNEHGPYFRIIGYYYSIIVIYS